MDRRKVLCLMVGVACLLFAGMAEAQCPGGQCGPVKKSVLLTYKGVPLVFDKALDGVKRVAQPLVRRAVVRKIVTRRGVFRRIFSRR